MRSVGCCWLVALLLSSLAHLQDASSSQSFFLTTVDDLEQFRAQYQATGSAITDTAPANYAEDNNNSDNNAQGNLRFFSSIWNLLRGLAGNIGYFFECILGLSLLHGGLFTSPCTCTASVLQRKIQAAASSSGLIPTAIEICRNREIAIGSEIDISGANFVLACPVENGDCRVTGQGSSRLFVGDPTFAAFFDLTLTKGAASNGAIFRLTGGATTVARSVLSDSVASDTGGALFVTGVGTIVSVANCTLVNNQAAAVGGAIHVEGSRVLLQFTGDRTSLLVENSAGLNGGAIAAVGEENQILVYQTEFHRNRAAAGDGGAMFMENGISEHHDVVFAGNEANGNGGAFFLRESQVSFDDAAFIGNTAQWMGGALAVNHSKVYLDPRKRIGFRENVANAGSSSGDDIAILDDQDPAVGGSDVVCSVNGADNNLVVFCSGASAGVFEDGGIAFNNTDCDAETSRGPLSIDGDQSFCQ